MVVRVSRQCSVLAVLVLVAALLAPLGAWARAAATGLRLGSHPDGITRLVLDLSDGIDFNTALYADPYRLVINTPAMGWGPGAALKRPQGAVRALRFDEDSLGGRIMIDLAEPAVVKSAFVIPPRDGQGWRFVMDLQATSRAAFLNAAVNAATPSRVAKAEAKPAAAVPVPAPRVEARPQPRPEMSRPEPGRADVARTESPRQPEPVMRGDSVTRAPDPLPATQPVAPAQAASPAPDAAPPMAEAPRGLVVYSPENSDQAAQQGPVVLAQPVVESRPGKPLKTSAPPVMSAQLPPPLDRNATPAMAAPRPDSASAATRVSVPVATPEPMAPRALPADGKPVVVLDPGHGGVDPGAIGVSGIYEKYITLAVAQELKAALERNGRYKVFLTRDRDIFIRLRDRVAIARQYNADLFISLHADSVGNPQLRGLSVYTLSQNASDSEAQALADKENKADLIAGIDLSHESADVANILIDLAQRETMNRSAGFAGGVVDEVGRETSLLANSHRFAGFAVLKAPDVPAVLIELGYLSNETEERNLRQPDYRSKLAKGISRAVDRFFLQGQKARRP